MQVTAALKNSDLIGDLMSMEFDGAKAFADGVPASECPYAFNRSPYWESKDYAGFEREWKPKLNVWMNGWLAAKKESERG